MILRRMQKYALSTKIEIFDIANLVKDSRIKNI